MPSGFLWVAIQVLKTEMEYCVRVEARSCLPEYKNPLKIIRSDMRKIKSSGLLAHAISVLLGKR